MTFAQHLRASMAADNLTLDALAERTGLSRYTILKARSDRTKVRLETAQKIALACGFSLDSVSF